MQTSSLRMRSCSMTSIPIYHVQRALIGSADHYRILGMSSSSNGNGRGRGYGEEEEVQREWASSMNPDVVRVNVALRMERHT